MNFIADTFNDHLFPIARKHHYKNKTYLIIVKSLILNYLMLIKMHVLFITKITTK